jgi:membrane protease subunit (stomatin/prohibitin family)
MKKPSLWVFATLAAVLVAGCQNQRAPAEQAVAAAESSLTNIRDAASHYAPDQLQSVDAQLNSAKDSLAKGDYKGVLAGMPALNTAINSLRDTATAKQQEAEAANAKAKDAWGPMSTDVPKMVDAISSRVDILSKSHHLPKGVTKDSLASAKSAVDSMKSAWSDASNAATSGDYATAVSKGQGVRDQASQVMHSLGMASG